MHLKMACRLEKLHFREKKLPVTITYCQTIPRIGCFQRGTDIA